MAAKNPDPTKRLVTTRKKSKPKPNTSSPSVPQQGSLNIGPTRDAATAQVGNVTNAQPAQIDRAAQSAGSQLDLANDNQFRGNQQDLISQLQAQSRGEGPSIANDQFKAAADRNIAQQRSLAASARGSSAGLAGRQAMINSAGIGQDLAQQSAVQRMTEQLNAQQALGNVVNQGRSADQNVAGQNATLTQGNMQYNATQANDINKAQGQLSNAASLQNAADANDLTKTQAVLGNATNLANAGATNQARIAQAQVNQASNAATKYSTSQVAAANAAAGASKYGSDAANYRAQLNTQLGLDTGVYN